MALRFTFLVDVDRETTVLDLRTERMIDEMKQGGFGTGNLITLLDALADLREAAIDLYEREVGLGSEPASVEMAEA